MSGARPDTWMPWYPGDFLRDTMHLNAEEDGAYRRLIDACWLRGGLLPDDDTKFAAITKLPVKRWRAIKSTIAEFFQVSEDGWRQGRVTRELEKLEQMLVTKSRAGKASAAAKAQRRANTRATDDQQATNRAPADVQQNAYTLADKTPTDPLTKINHPQPPPPKKEEDDLSDNHQTAARALADAFLAIRTDLWPGSKPLAYLTVQTQAAELLGLGISLDRCIDVVVSACRRYAETGKSVIGSLKFFTNSVRDAVADHSAVNGYSLEDPDEARRRRKENEEYHEELCIREAALGRSSPGLSPTVMRKGIAAGRITREAAFELGYDDIWDQIRGKPA